MPWDGSKGRVKGMGSMCVLTSQLLVHEEGERQRVFTQVGKPLPALAELGSDSGSS